jgi:S-adenosylmethionine:tRNA ribosyltransferase-isomerase
VSLVPTQPFSYTLQPELIAQRPIDPPEDARLLVADGGLEEATFQEIGRFLDEKDLLVFNDTAVVPARLFGWVPESEKEVEVLLLREEGKNAWTAIGRPMRVLRRSGVVLFPEELTASVEVSGRDELLLTFSVPEGFSFPEILNSIGTMPIPPYIRQGKGDQRDKQDYQTIFAKKPGAVAAPTASLHFTPRLMQQLSQQGVAHEFLTLHVGSASFRQVEPQQLPGKERFEIAASTLDRLQEWRRSGGRVVAVGTTVVRALESGIRGLSGETDLFITPGFDFKIVDSLITNFHQPQTTHLLLVEALLGRDLLSRAYEYAVSHKFRFLSYGDGMFIRRAQ